jgi:hypothetical protein
MCSHSCRIGTDIIEAKVDKLEEDCISELFWNDGTPKAFSDVGAVLGKGASGKIICSSVSWLQALFANFIARAILGGAVKSPLFDVPSLTVSKGRLSTACRF